MLKFLLIFFAIKYHYASYYTVTRNKGPPQSQARFLVVLKDKKLVNVNNFVKYGMDQLQCLGQCINFPKCHSINLNMAEKICMVNYEVDEFEKEQNIISEQGWVYYEKEVDYNEEEVVFAQSEEFSLIRNSHIYTIPYWSKSWMISFEIKPKGIIGTRHSGILLLSAVGGKCCTTGQRQPGLYFMPQSTKLHVSLLNGEQLSFVDTQELQLNRYHTVKITYISSPDGSGNNRYTVEINGVVKHDVISTYAPFFTNVKVYASDSYHSAADADVRHLHLVNLGK